MSVVTEEMVRTIAAMLDHPSVYMGGPSQRNMRRAEQIIAAVAPLIAKAERERCAVMAETHEWFVGGIGTKALGSGQAKAIAAAMSRSKREIPHYYLSETVVMKKAQRWLMAENEKKIWLSVPGQ